MVYTSMKKLITNANTTLANGTMTQDEYDLFVLTSMNKLDVFLTCNRLTEPQYQELVGLLQPTVA